MHERSPGEWRIARDNRKRRMRYGSLFSGLGSFDLAFHRAGMECAWMVENDAACQRVLRHHWPDVPLFSDVKDVGTHNLAPVDVIIFGSPCQGLSVAGLRAGFIDERSNLFYEAIRIVGELRPTFALWENVFGALSSNSGRDFAAALAAFQELGPLDIGWATLDAQHFGVPQRRRRVFLVADFGGHRAGEILFKLEGVSRDTEESGKERTGIAATLTSGSGRNGNRGGRRREDDHNLVVNALTSSHGGADDNDAQANHLFLARCETSRQGRDDGDSQTFVAAIKGAAIGRQPQNGPQRGEVLDDGTCYTLNATETRAVSANAIVRRLMPIETLRLQGLPDDWLNLTPPLSDAAKYRMVGNAGAEPVLYWIAQRIFDAQNK